MCLNRASLKLRFRERVRIKSVVDVCSHGSQEAQSFVVDDDDVENGCGKRGKQTEREGK